MLRKKYPGKCVAIGIEEFAERRKSACLPILKITVHISQKTEYVKKQRCTQRFKINVYT